MVKVLLRQETLDFHSIVNNMYFLSRGMKLNLIFARKWNIGSTIIDPLTSSVNFNGQEVVTSILDYEGTVKEYYD